MLLIGKWAGYCARVAIVVAALAFSGCSTFVTDAEPVADEPEIVIEAPQPIVEDTPPTKVPKPPRLPPIAIVLTSEQAAYADVARELTQHLQDYEIYDLSDRSRPPVTILRLINDSDSSTVVAIGLRAAQSSVAMADTPVVFSQVFNHQDHALLTDNSRGIATLAPLDAQLAAWKDIEPTLTRVGAIIGEGHDELIAEAELAAARHNVELRVQIAHSDQETLYLFKRMIRDIDGYWLFPDNRILSARILQQMLDEANRQHVPVAVSNESMLSMGAAISMSAVASDVAETIIDVVRQIQAGRLDRVPPITALSEMRVVTNDELLKKPAVASSSDQARGQDEN